ncbi:MAG: hypothetical protein WCX79_00760 [Candidatus Paceibacterota bacterium]
MVDVDNTLFDFATPLYEMFIKDGINISPPTEWNIWDYFYPEYMTSKVAHEYFNNVHSHQLEYEPFEDARVFLRDLMMYYKVVIVSHRRPHHCGILKEWLDINHLSYDEVKCSNDKTKMFDKDVFDVVIDDCPMTLTAAKNAGIVGYGLIRPWNVGCKDGVLLSTLTEIGKCGGWIE